MSSKLNPPPPIKYNCKKKGGKQQLPVTAINFKQKKTIIHDL